MRTQTFVVVLIVALVRWSSRSAFTGTVIG